MRAPATGGQAVVATVAVATAAGIGVVVATDAAAVTGVAVATVAGIGAVVTAAAATKGPPDGQPTGDGATPPEVG